MKKRILTSSLLFISIITFSQTQILEELDFSEGEWALFGTLWWNTPQSDFSKKHKHFYIDNTSCLRKIKTSWILEEGPFYWCGYDYTLFFTKNSKIIATMEINIECNSLVINGEAYTFNKALMTPLLKHLKPLKKTYRIFENIDSARTFCQKEMIKKNRFFPYKHEYFWLRYNGYFDIKPNNIDHWPDYDSEESAILTHTQELLDPIMNKATYSLKIQVYSKGYSSIRVFCDQKDFPKASSKELIINKNWTPFQRPNLESVEKFKVEFYDY